MRFQNRVALVTGAASGMGLLASKKFAAEGASVVLVDVNADAARQAAAEIQNAGGNALAVPTDIRDHAAVNAAVNAAVQSFGSVDILLNSAGGHEGRVHSFSGPFHAEPLPIVDWGVEVNFRAPIYFAHAVLPKMEQQKRGVIINMGSVDGLTGAAAGIIYSAAKSGMIGLTKSLALHGAPFGIRAVCVTPGPVLTRPAMAKMKTPLGRAAQPDEVVSLILYLASDDAAFITGSNHTIDGARSCGGLS